LEQPNEPDDISEEHLMSEEFLKQLMASNTYWENRERRNILEACTETVSSIDEIIWFARLHSKSKLESDDLTLEYVAEKIEFFEKNKIVEHTPEGWRLTELGINVKKEIKKREKRERSRLKFKKHVRKEPESWGEVFKRIGKIVATFIVICIAFFTLFVLWELIKIVSEEIKLFFSGIFGTFISWLIWIPGIIVLFLVLLFFSWILSNLGFEVSLFQFLRAHARESVV
jgi:hypothetical protein